MALFVRLAALVVLASAKPDPETFRRLESHLSVLGVVVDRDTLADVQERLGAAEVRPNGGTATASASAACFVGPDGTTLAFISVTEMGGGRQAISDFHLAANEPMVVYSPAFPGYEVPRASRPRCAPLPALSKATGTAGGLRLGMTVAEVTQLLGKPTEAAPEGLAYYGEREGGPGVRSVRLQLAGGRVTGILAELDTL
jgi:hypothetical protein